MKDTRDQDTLDSARPKARTEPLPGNASVEDPFYDPARDLPDVGNRFEVLGRLGEGGMGEVFQARDLELDEIVALKILTPQFGEDQSRLNRLRQEVKLARKISSPAVCRLHDLIELPGGVRGIAMEFVAGQTLGQLIDQGLPVDYERIGKWGADISEGLAAAHKLSIIHRDLKPDNIMITQDDRAMILDFGVARHHEESEKNQRLTREGMILGTVPYMAPEQLSNAPLDPRSDLYSLGLILAELITGEIPAYGSSYHDTLNKRVIAPEIYLLEHHDPGVPEELAAAVNHMLRTTRDERPFSAMMVSDHLRAFSNTKGLSVESAPALRLSTTPPPSFEEFSVPVSEPSSTPKANTNRPMMMGLLIAVAALCVGLAIAVAQMTKTKPAPQVSDKPSPAVVKQKLKAKPPKTKAPVVEKQLKSSPVKIEKEKKLPPAQKKRPRKIKRKKKSNDIPTPEEL